MRKAARIVERMHARILEVIEPGMRKNDLVAEIYHAAITGVEGAGGDYPAIVPMLPTGIDASAAHLTWDDKPMRAGEATFFEIAGVYRRYHCPLCRTVFLGKPSARERDAEGALLEAIEAGLDAARPGNRCEDIHARVHVASLARHGLTKESRCGYSIGLSYPPDWGERTISLRPGDRTELEPNMTIHFMPALWFEDWGLEITESIRITETGCRNPRQLAPRATGEGLNRTAAAALCAPHHGSGRSPISAKLHVPVIGNDAHIDGAVLFAEYDQISGRFFASAWDQQAVGSEERTGLRDFL